ncbi:MAG: sensor histidine kinase [Chiayiivirga sp.]|uniref:sensor histidine kinase n=1 Tax=Chiayiivirga sp. TaxID=2041042 RepID=UPI0025BDD7A6|nr:sensor histidine kinase [Chiayiivirga sp.]MCI1710065.1 sensor histidine kinase [Chiayiivirga sp.]MCI1729142.1 sensor histidine kinase [Chiayiivirga sp.]
MRAPASLRWRLLLAGMVGVLLAAIGAALLLGAAFERAALRGLDRRLSDDLDALIALADAGTDGQVQLRREPAEERYDRVFSGWYWLMQVAGETRTSRSAWDASELEGVLPRAQAQRQFLLAAGPRVQSLRVALQEIRMPGAAVPAVFAVAGDLAEVRAEAQRFRWFAALSVAIIAFVLLAVVALQVEFGLRPLRRIAATLERIRRGESTRFETASLPSEVAPLATQVNELLDEHQRRIERARRGAADLAHALKTPLAALALESELGQGEFAQRVATEVQRMRAAVERRLVGTIEADLRQRMPVRPVLDSLLSLMRRAYADRTLDLRVEGEDGVFPGTREDLEEVLGNLLDNACKWAATRVEARLVSEPGATIVRIEDDGPGLLPEQAERALQRGVRLDEREPGSGLGLAIVDDIVRSHGGTLRLGRADLGGLRVELRFPLPA